MRLDKNIMQKLYYGRVQLSSAVSDVVFATR